MLWILGIMVCVGQSIGASLEVRLAIKHGAKIIRPIAICVCFALSMQLLIRDFFRISGCNFTPKYFYAIMHDFKNL